MFDVRPTNVHVGYCSNHTPGQKAKDSIVDGDEVVLKIGDERILVRDVRTIGAGKYSATVYGFEPSFSTSYKGLVEGQRVEFEYGQVFGCSSR